MTLLVDYVYLAFSGAVALTGLALVGLAARAYVSTERPAMLHLSLGFTLIVAATIATAISAFVTDFQNGRSLLLVMNGLSALGFAFVLYSLLAYDTGQSATAS